MVKLTIQKNTISGLTWENMSLDTKLNIYVPTIWNKKRLTCKINNHCNGHSARILKHINVMNICDINEVDERLFMF